MDLPQLAQTVRSVWFPSARQALPLVGMTSVPISSHHVELNREARPRDGWRRGSDRCPAEIDQVPVASDPASDEQRAAITRAPELPADVPAREPDAPVPDLAEQGWSR